MPKPINTKNIISSIVSAVKVASTKFMALSRKGKVAVIFGLLVVYGIISAPSEEEKAQEAGYASVQEHKSAIKAQRDAEEAQRDAEEEQRVADEAAQDAERAKKKAERNLLAEKANEFTIEISCELHGSRMAVGQCFNDDGTLEVITKSNRKMYDFFEVFNMRTNQGAIVLDMNLKTFKGVTIKKGYKTEGLKLKVLAKTFDGKTLYSEEETQPYGRIRLR